MMVCMPVWTLAALVAGLWVLAFVAAWVNAWVAVRFVRRGGRFTAGGAERLLTRRARRALEDARQAEEAMGSGDYVPDPDDEGQVVP